MDRALVKLVVGVPARLGEMPQVSLERRNGTPLGSQAPRGPVPVQQERQLMHTLSKH